MNLAILPLHMGALHPVEQALTYALAFGPFVVLGGVIWWRRRSDEVTEEPASGDPAQRKSQRER